MRSRRSIRVIRVALCWLTAALFVAAAVGKIRDPLAFADSIAAYELVPWKTGITLLALSLPTLEIILAAGLVTPRWRRTASLGTGLLMAVFTAALVSALIKGLVIDCGCFGGASFLNMPIPHSIARNAVILIICAAVYAGEISGRHTSP